MRKLLFVFGGEEYQIKEPSYKAGKKWRKRFEARMTELASLAEGDLVAALKEAASLQVPETTEELGEVARAGDILTKISPAIGKIAKIALGSIDEAADLLFTYGADLKAKRDEIEEVAYSDEILAALWVVIQSAYPFLSLRDTITAALDQIGLQQQQTSTNSAGQNGVTETIAIQKS